MSGPACLFAHVDFIEAHAYRAASALCPLLEGRSEYLISRVWKPLDLPQLDKGSYAPIRTSGTPVSWFSAPNARAWALMGMGSNYADKEDGMKIIALILVLVLLPLPNSMAEAHNTSSRGNVGRWVCNAYGYSSGPRNVWSTVTGALSGSQAAGRADALQECQRKLNGCRTSGCWVR